MPPKEGNDKASASTAGARGSEDALMKDLHQRVSVLFEYFDCNRDGLLHQSEFEKMLEAVTLGQTFTKGVYAEACRAAGVAKIKKGIDNTALTRLYANTFFSLDDHFAAFQKVCALPEDSQLLHELKAWSNPQNVPCSIEKVKHLSDGSCVVHVTVHVDDSSQLYLFENGTLQELDSNIEVEWLGRGQLHPHQPGLLVFGDGVFQVVEIDRETSSSATLKVTRSLGSFPHDWGDVDDEDEDDGKLWSACLDAYGKLHVVALVQEKSRDSFLVEEGEGVNSGDKAPIVYSLRRKRKFLVASHAGCKLDLCQVPARASNLQISDDGQWCSYSVKIGEVQEEAEQGEWYVCRLSSGESPRKISQGPVGRIGDEPARFSPSGEYVVYQANHTETHPITTHMDLWLVSLRAGDSLTPTKISPGSMQIDVFDWAQGSNDLLWISGTEKSDLCSFLLSISTKKLDRIEPPAAFECLPSWNPQTGKAVYPVEGADDFMGIWDESVSRITSLPEWSESFEDVLAESVQWVGPGNTKVHGAVYRSAKTLSIDRTLLVWVHGGPTFPWPVLRRAGLNSEEFNFLALLRAGYLVFVPLYRGTLGFGDGWSMATCGCQGSLDGDLGDILTGVAHLQRTQLHGCSTRAGIFGESYGGYLTIRAMADLEARKVFQCGVSWYGYVTNRGTTLLTGDFTWEREFCQEGPDVWPPPERVADSFNKIGNIKGPLLLCHGADDDVCPVSHSEMVYRALRRRGVPTDLVVYPGFGHGFGSGRAGFDAHWRTLQWFLRHLPPSSGDFDVKDQT